MIYIILYIVVLLGGISAFLIEGKPEKKYIHFLLSFSGAYLLSIIVFHLLPEIYSSSERTVGVFILLGILFQLFLEVFSHGAEHGHKHAFHKKTPWIVMLSLVLHAFMEGLPINSQNNFHSSYFIAILVHKLPISIILTTLMISAGYSVKKTLILLFIFASATPLAAYLGDELFFLKEYATYINAFVVGILAHVGTTILFENEHSHTLKLRKFGVIILAMFIAYLT